VSGGAKNHFTKDNTGRRPQGPELMQMKGGNELSRKKSRIEENRERVKSVGGLWRPVFAYFDPRKG